eukprot:scaffold47353_cov60-Phaeocystis_antarctica.AAC.3
MGHMFLVRSSPCPAPNLQSSPPLRAACAAVAFHLPPPGPNPVPHRMPSFRLAAARVGVQPAAELRHLQRHDHALHVLPGVGVQPATELRHLQRHKYGSDVLRALHSPCPAPNLQSPPLHAACAAVARRLPARTSPRIVCPPFDSAASKLPVQRQQAAHPLRVGGQLGLRLRWLWLELGSGNLLAELNPSSRCA